MNNVTGNSRAILIIEVLLILGFTVGLRYVSLPDLIAPGQVMVVPDDPPYHLRRVKLMLNSPRTLYTGDPFVDYPNHAKVCWGFGFDGLLAGVVGLIKGKDADLNQIALITSVMIPLLAALVLLMVFLLFRRSEGEAWALAALVLMGVFHHYFEYSFVGRVDHHVLEPVFALLLLVFLRWPVLAGLFAGVAPGFALAALVPAYLLGAVVSAMWVCDDYKTGSLKTGKLWLGVTGGGIIALLLSPNPLTFVYYSPSLVHVLFPAAISIGAFGFYKLAKSAPKSGKIAACTRFSALVLLAIGLLIGLIPQLRAAVGNSIKLSSGKSMGIAMESLPFFVPFTKWHVLSIAMIGLSLTGGYYTFKHRRDLVPRAIVILGLIGWMAAAAQRRWLVGFSPFVVMSAVLGLRGLGAFVSAPVLKRWVIAFVLGLLVFFYSWHDLRTRPISFSGRMAYAVGNFIRQNTVPIDPEGPQYGILAPWSLGHVIQAYGGRPTVCDNFFGVPSNDLAMRRCSELFMETDMARLKRELKALHIKYVVVAPPDPRQVSRQLVRMGRNPLEFITKNGKFKLSFARTMLVRLGAMKGRAFTLPDGSRMHRLSGFRLLHSFRVHNGHGKVKAEASIFEFNP